MPLSIGDAPKGSYAHSFIQSWDKRVAEAQQAGINPNQLRSVIRQDWQRVRSGSSPYSNMEAGLAVHSVLSGKPLINVDNNARGGGLIGGLLNTVKNIPADLGNVVSGLNPMTLGPALLHQGEQFVEDPAQVLKPFGTLATGDITKAFKQASRTPILDLVPGIYTAKNVLTGNWNEIQEHPVQTGLDVLPYASEVGKLAMAGRAVEGSAEAANLADAGRLRGTVEPQSPQAALLEGKPLKAGLRAVGGTTDSPLSQRWFRAVEQAKRATGDIKPLLYGGTDAPNGARVVATDGGGYIENPPSPQSFGKQGKGAGSSWVNKLTKQADKAEMPLELHVSSTHDAAINMYQKHGFEVMREDGPLTLLRREPVKVQTPTVYRTSDAIQAIAEKYGFDRETKELNRFHNIMRRKAGRYAEMTHEDYASMFKDMSDEEKRIVLKVAQRYKPGQMLAAMDSKMTPEMEDAIKFFRQHTDELAEPHLYDPREEVAQRAAHRESGSKDEFAPEGTAVRENKQFIAVPNEGGSVDVYPLSGDTGRAYQRVFEKQRKLDPLQKRLDAANERYSTAELAAGETGTPIPEDVTRAQEAAKVKHEAAAKELERAQTLYDKIHNRAAPARYGELLKDQVRGQLQSRVSDMSEDAIHSMWRYSDNAIERDVANPQGAFVASDPRDFEAVSQGRPLNKEELRPQMPLDVHARDANQGLGEATLNHFNEGDTARVIADRVREGDVTGAVEQAEQRLGIEFTKKEKARLENGTSPGEMMDIAGAKLAKKYGHDTIFKHVDIGSDPAHPTWKAHEAAVLDESALLKNQKTPVLTAQQAADAAEHITNNNFSYLVDQGIISAGELHGVMNDVMNNWQELARQGFDPVYVPFVPESKLPYLFDQKPLAGNLYTPRQFLSKDTLSFAPQAQDLAVAMTSYAVELMKQQGSLEMFNQVKTLGVTEKMLADRYGIDKARQIISQNYIPFSETAGRFLSKPEMALLPDAEKLLIPRVLNKNLDRMMNTFEHDGLFGAYDKAMKVYKYAVLTGPRHIAHVLFGGLMMGMGEHGVMAFPKFLEAYKAVREGRIPPEMSRGLDQVTPGRLGQPSPSYAERVAEMGQGRTLGRLFVEAIGSVPKAMNKFEELISDTQRMMTYLHEVDKRMGAAGKDAFMHDAVPAEIHSAAMKLTNKLYMDIDGMAPVERTVIRHVFPFYSFTKHILRYVLNYPADHPWRASVLSNMMRIEQEDHASGLPSQFNDFLFLGDTDANGNQTAIDVKNFNPFRSLDGQSPFTLAGFLSAMGPAFTLPAQVAGLNTLTATPDLYPTLHYDARTGKLVASHPDLIPQAIQTMLPPTGALQGILGLSDQWRSLKKADPSAYSRALFSAMNMPFVPQTRNIGVERTKAEINRYRAAQQDVSAAIKTGDTGHLSSAYKGVVPFQGELVPVEKLAELIKRLKKLSPTGSPGTIIPRTSGKGSLGAALARH